MTKSNDEKVIYIRISGKLKTQLKLYCVKNQTNMTAVILEGIRQKIKNN